MQGRVVASGTEYLIELPTTYRLTSKSNLRNWVNLGSRSYRCFNDDYKKIISQFRYSLIEYILNERKEKLSGVYRSIYLHLSFLFFFSSFFIFNFIILLLHYYFMILVISFLTRNNKIRKERRERKWKEIHTWRVSFWQWVS